MSNDGASFVTVRSKLISLETRTTSLLTKYSTFSQATSSQASGEETSLSSKIEKALQERQGLVETLQNICNDTNNNISASKLSQLQRHKEILGEHSKSFRNLRSGIQQERNRLNLLFSAKTDIENLSAKNRNNTEEEAYNQEDYIQDESRRIDESHNTIDRLISQAWETRDSFRFQSSMLNNANNTMFQALNRIPVVNKLLGKIGTRRRKNALVLASVLTCCILFLFFTM